MTVDDVKNVTVVYSDAKAGAGFFFSVDDNAYNFKVTATLKNPEAFGRTAKNSVIDLLAKDITYNYNKVAVKSPSDTFKLDTGKTKAHVYKLDVLLKGKSLNTKAVAYIGVRGDANLDDTVDSKDAVKVLQFHAATMVYAQDQKTVPVLYSDKDAGFESLAKYLGNANLSKDKSVDAKDSVTILKFYAQVMVHANNPAEKEAVWEDMYKAES